MKKQNPMALPRLVKIVLNVGLKEALKDAKLIDEVVAQLALILGQRPVVTRARAAIAGFKLRKGDPIGVMVTIRGKRMHDFYEKLVRVVLPRLRDFHGVSNSSFDGHGNYSLGFSEITVFPEIDAAALGKNFGVEVTIQTSARTDDEARKLLEMLGMPFKKVRS